MEKIITIFKNDLKDILKNKALMVIIIGLSILPSLYAWFNIKASWDPYSNTQNIKVAVVNSDKGSKIFAKNINVGNELSEKLKDDKNLGWEFVDKEKADKGVNNGTYYASIEIPSNFSKDIVSLLSNKATKAEIRYTVNEKINAIAPKITDKGASTIQNQVNQNVVEMVSKVVLELSNDVGIEIQGQVPKLSNLEKELKEVQDKFTDVEDAINFANDSNKKINSLISSINNDMPLIEDTVVNAITLSDDIKIFLESSQSELKNLSPVIKNDLGLINEVSKKMTKDIENIIDLINKGSENAPNHIKNLYDKVVSLKNSSSSMLKLLNNLNKLFESNKLEKAIRDLGDIVNNLEIAQTSLKDIKDKIESGVKPSTDSLDKILSISKSVEQISGNLLNNFDEQISRPINNIFNDSYKLLDDTVIVLNDAKEKLPLIKDILTSSDKFSDSLDDNIIFINEKLPLAKEVLNELVNKVSDINKDENLNELITFLKNDTINKSEFLREPATLVSKKLYQVDNYGSAMTPFYTVLSLWVGVLLLTSVLSVEVKGDYSSKEVYFGRGLTFALISTIQSLIVSIGNFIVLGVSATNPILFVILSVFTSLIFSVIVYSLVSIFSNIGKAMAIILLVIQVSASGGTFPVEVTPSFFKFINPYLPFTYAIGALRESVGGIYLANLSKDILVLISFMLIFIVLSILFKEKINDASKGFREKVSKSDLIGH